MKKNHDQWMMECRTQLESFCVKTFEELCEIAQHPVHLSDSLNVRASKTSSEVLVEVMAPNQLRGLAFLKRQDGSQVRVVFDDRYFCSECGEFQQFAELARFSHGQMPITLICEGCYRYFRLASSREYFLKLGGRILGLVLLFGFLLSNLFVCFRMIQEEMSAEWTIYGGVSLIVSVLILFFFVRGFYRHFKYFPLVMLRS